MQCQSRWVEYNSSEGDTFVLKISNSKSITVSEVIMVKLSIFLNKF